VQGQQQGGGKGADSGAELLSACSAVLCSALQVHPSQVCVVHSNWGLCRYPMGATSTRAAV
jgi:hypothetical protein